MCNMYMQDKMEKHWDIKGWLSWMRDLKWRFSFSLSVIIYIYIIIITFYINF